MFSSCKENWQRYPPEEPESKQNWQGNDAPEESWQVCTCTWGGWWRAGRDLHWLDLNVFVYLSMFYFAEVKMRESRSNSNWVSLTEILFLFLILLFFFSGQIVLVQVGIAVGWFRFEWKASYRSAWCRSIDFSIFGISQSFVGES